ncbi:hypothetical protein Tco_1088917 [Tanacetum coccineum]
MPKFSSNDMVHNHYLEEAKKKTQERGRKSRPSVMPSARSQSTAYDSKPKPRINNQKSRNWPASKSSYVTTKTVHIAEHSRNSRNFSDCKHFVCSTCQKCIFNANHDHCVRKFLNEVNSHAKVPSNKTTNRNKPVEQISVAKKLERQISKGHRFSIKKTSVVHEKTMTPKSCLRWKPTGKIFTTVGLRWVPTGKIFTSSTTKVDNEPKNGSDEDITNQYEYEQTLDTSVGTLNLSAGTSFNPKKEGLRVCSKLGIHDHSNESSSLKLVPNVSPSAYTIVLSQQELDLLFGTLYDEFSLQYDIMDPVMQCTSLPSHSSFSQKKLVSFVTKIHTTSIDFLTPIMRTASAAAKPRQEDSSEFNLITTVFILINEESWLYGGGSIPFQLKSDSLPHAHVQTTKTYYKHQDSSIKKAQVLKIKTSAYFDIKDNSLETKLRGRLLVSFQEDAKYEHVGQDTRSQGGKDDQDKQGK